MLGAAQQLVRCYGDITAWMGKDKSLSSWICLEIEPEQDGAEQACLAVTSLVVVTQMCTFRAGDPLYVYKGEENAT